MKGFLIAFLFAIAACGCHKNRSGDQKSFEDQTCKIRLQMIYHAKQLWADRNQKTVQDTPTWEDLRPFLRGVSPKCPSGATYTIGKVGEPPTCTVPGHVMDLKPQDN
jgi:hypothetical protein